MNNHTKDVESWLQALPMRVAQMDDAANWIASEVKLNIAPLMLSSAKILDDLQDSVDSLNEVVSELIEHEESYLQPDLAQQITTLIQVGMRICEESMQLASDEITKKRIGDLVAVYTESAVLVQERVEEITVLEEEENEDASRIHGESRHTERTLGVGERSLNEDSDTASKRTERD